LPIILCKIVQWRLDVDVRQVIIASIMCGYNKEDWTELSQMAEVRPTKLLYTM